MSENYLGIMMRIISGNYHIVYNITWISHGKVEIYRDTGVSKNGAMLAMIISWLI